MPIPVIHDGSPQSEPAEQCCFCYRPTRFWYAKKDVAVCPDDAHFRKCSEVPSKVVWCENVRKRREEREKAYYDSLRANAA